MRHPVFRFKRFLIKQDKSHFRITTDSVLLGAYANPKKVKTILDVGTGTGIIALMLAQRSWAEIDGIEISRQAFQIAQQNFMRSKWSSRLNIYHQFLQNFFPEKKYDVIICNPPYYSCTSSLCKRSRAEVRARFNHNLPFEELLENVMRLLKPKGKFYTILPVREGTSLINQAEQRNFFLTDYMWVKTTAKNQLPKRLLMQFEFTKKQLKEDKVLTIQDQNGYTEEYKKLMHDYFLRF